MEDEEWESDSATRGFPQVSKNPGILDIGFTIPGNFETPSAHPHPAIHNPQSP